MEAKDKIEWWYQTSFVALTLCHSQILYCNHLGQLNNLKRSEPVNQTAIEV